MVGRAGLFLGCAEFDLAGVGSDGAVGEDDGLNVVEDPVEAGELAGCVEELRDRIGPVRTRRSSAYRRRPR